LPVASPAVPPKRPMPCRYSRSPAAPTIPWRICRHSPQRDADFGRWKRLARIWRRLQQRPSAACPRVWSVWTRLTIGPSPPRRQARPAQVYPQRARLPGAAALSRGHCHRAVEIAPSPRLIQFDAQHVARKGCPCRTDRRPAISATSAHSREVGLVVNCRRVRSKYGETVIAARALVLHLAEYKRSVGAAKSEGVRQRNIDGAFARFVGHEIDGSID
jgi:hypothetical protein